MNSTIGAGGGERLLVVRQGAVVRLAVGEGGAGAVRCGPGGWRQARGGTGSPSTRAMGT